MVECYRCNNRGYTAKQRGEIGHFFNTASDILDTIGSMTEGSILRSVEISISAAAKKKRILQGESLTGSRYTQIGNRPEANLFPTRDNLLKYTAIYPGVNFNVTHIEPYQPSGNIFSANYPNYPDLTTMVEDPTSIAMGRLEGSYSMDISDNAGDDGYLHPRIKRNKMNKTTRPSSSDIEDDEENDSYV